MKLIQCRFSSGQRVPMLVQAGNAAPLPKLVPFIYVQLKLRHRAYNTAHVFLLLVECARCRSTAPYLIKLLLITRSGRMRL